MVTPPITPAAGLPMMALLLLLLPS
jgi:hypothetical protein